jgi:SAM-dependent methyltransferase
MIPASPSLDRHTILRELAPGNLVQPATALWRVYEIEAVRRHVLFDGRVLDVGCGDGSLARVVFRGYEALDLVGLEPDATDANAARRSGLYRSVHCAFGDRIPERDASFDQVFSNSVLEHIPELEPVLADISRVLKTGGAFVFTVPSEFFHDCLGGDTLPERLLRRGNESTHAAIDRRLRHYRYWSEREWREKLAAVGLEVTRAVRYFPREAVQAWQRISGWTGGLAFELLGRTSETRGTQRRLGLDRLDAVVPQNTREALLSWLLRREMDWSDDPAPQASGGLLVEARKR